MAATWLETYATQRPENKNLYAAATRCIAGGVGHDYRHTQPFPLYIQRAAGARMWDVDGNQYIDYGMGNASYLLGHGPADVLAAIHQALDNGLHFGEDHPLQVEWAQLIQQLIPVAERVRFVNSGTEATMLALRLARAFTGRTKVLRFEGHYHGWHDYAAIGAAPPFDASMSAGIPAAVLDSIVVVPADLQVVEDTLRQDKDIAAVILEPAGGSWATIPVSVEFNRELRQLTSRYEVPLIFDEVITGFRYSSGGYQKYAGITPDLSTLGKIVTGGMPGAAIAGRADIMQLFDYTGDAHHDRYERVMHLGTFNANPPTAAGGVATLKQAASGAPQAHADRMAARLRQGMEEILENSGVAGYAYGDSSIFHVYLEAFPGSGAASRDALRTSDPAVLKGIPPHVITALQKNMQIRGAKLLSYNGGVTSAAHTEEDIDQTLESFQGTIEVLLREEVVGRVG
jgi:glutamate-1-semialdehyde 2,1-aminomutase